MTAQQLRLEVSSIISPSKPPKDNLKGRHHHAIQSLRRDKEIVIPPTNKGNATVVMNRCDYIAKMDELLRDCLQEAEARPHHQNESQNCLNLKELGAEGSPVHKATPCPLSLHILSPTELWSPKSITTYCTHQKAKSNIQP